jgi:hypothetical protein
MRFSISGSLRGEWGVEIFGGMRSPLNWSQNDRLSTKNHTRLTDRPLIAVSQPLHQSTEHQQTQPLLHFREQQKATHNLRMQLVFGGTALIVSVGAYFSYQVVRNLIL